MWPPTEVQPHYIFIPQGCLRIAQALQRWVGAETKISPGGTAEEGGIQSSLRDYIGARTFPQR